MAQLILNVGQNANDGTGDTLRDAMIKVNTNFTEIYASAGFDLTSIQVTGNEIRATRTNDDLIFKPAGSGAVNFPAISISGNEIIGTRSNENINLVPAGTGSVVFGAIKISGTTLSSDDSTAININDGLVVDGDLSVSGTLSFSGAITAGSGSTVGNLTLADGSITDSSGAISFGNENLSTTGTMTAGSGSTIGNLTLANGSITDSSGAISFGNENLSTTGTLQVDGLSTLGALTVTGAVTFGGGGVTVDTLNFNDNTISSSSNADIRLTPGGTGSVIVGSLTIDDNINITDNEIQATASNSNLVLSPSGTINSGAIDGTTIGASTPAAATFTTLTVTRALTLEGITIDDNTIKTNSSNANLELSANSSGTVKISGLSFPTSDGSTNQFLKTDGSGTLSFATAGATLNNSDLVDGTTTVATSTTTVMNTFATDTVRSAKYFISITDATNSRFEVVEANVTHDGSDAYISVFGSTTDHTGPLTTFTADVSGGNVRVLVTNTSSDSTVFKFQRISMDV